MPQPLKEGVVFEQLMGHFDDVYEQLGLHVTRLAQLQQQVDDSRAQLKGFVADAEDAVRKARRSVAIDKRGARRRSAKSPAPDK
jgi:ABC-type transporter Mla subunit MlaD